MNWVKVYLDIPMEALRDPSHKAEDCRNVGHWATGDTRFKARSNDESRSDTQALNLNASFRGINSYFWRDLSLQSNYQMKMFREKGIPAFLASLGNIRFPEHTDISAFHDYVGNH